MNVNAVNINSNLTSLALVEGYLGKLLLTDPRILVATLAGRRKLD